MSLQQELGLQNPFKDIRHETVLNIVRTGNLISVRAAQLFREYDLTEAQFNVLFTLKFAGDKITQAELSKRLVVTRASVTSVLDKLESKGLVRRVDVPENRRIHHVELTPEGVSMIERVEPRYRKEIHLVLACFEDDECQSLIGFLEQTRERVHGLLSTNGTTTK